MKLRQLTYILVATIMLPLLLSGCIEDGISTNPNDQPEFSVDTLHMGITFTLEGTPTHSFVVRNRNGKGISINSISLREEADRSVFRLNVDGEAGNTFHNVEIRANDSIYVFVEATLPENGTAGPIERLAKLDFTTNGVTNTVVLALTAIDVNRLNGVKIETDTRFSADKPYQIFDSLVVGKGETLTLEAGCQLRFHDKAKMTVHGTLIAAGTPNAPILFDGDRFGQVVGRIPYSIMSNQWEGIRFTAESHGNRLHNTVIRNNVWGVVLDSVPEWAPMPVVQLLRCRLTNSGSTVLSADASSVTAVGCEFSEGANGLVSLYQGNHVFNHCTFANNYLFSAISGPAILFDGDRISARIDNSIIYGIGADVIPGDLTGMDVTLRRCIMRSAGENDDNFIDILWEADPMFYTVRPDYFFDYRLKPESAAIGAADPALTLPEADIDFYGMSRGQQPDLGAYVYIAPQE